MCDCPGQFNVCSPSAAIGVVSSLSRGTTKGHDLPATVPPFTGDVSVAPRSHPCSSLDLLSKAEGLTAGLSGLLTHPASANCPVSVAHKTRVWRLEMEGRVLVSSSVLGHRPVSRPGLQLL